MPGGIFDALGQLFGYGYTGYSVGFSFVLPLSNKANQADYDRANVGDIWRLPRLREELESGADEITVEIEGRGEIKLAADLAPSEREILLAGGLLSYLREHGEQVSEDGTGAAQADRRAGRAAQAEERDQGPGGRAD